MPRHDAGTQEAVIGADTPGQDERLAQHWRTAALAESLAAAIHREGLRQAPSLAHASPTPALIDVSAIAAVDSTNTRLLEAARHDAAPAVRLLVAEQQRAGRGRLGRAWHSAPGESLTFSIAMPMPNTANEGLSLAIGAALAQALEPTFMGEPQVLLKWPNDVWLRQGKPEQPGGKLAGILIETTAAAGTNPRVLVVGIGLNLLPPAAPPQPAPLYGLASLHGWRSELGAVDALHLIAPAVVAAVLRFASQGLAPWQAHWLQRDVLLGQALQASAGQNTIEGIGCGVRLDGALLVKDAQGTMHAITSGEVSVRLTAA